MKATLFYTKTLSVVPIGDNIKKHICRGPSAGQYITFCHRIKSYFCECVR